MTRDRDTRPRYLGATVKPRKVAPDRAAEVAYEVHKEEAYWPGHRRREFLERAKHDDSLHVGPLIEIRAAHAEDAARFSAFFTSRRVARVRRGGRGR